MRDADGSTRYNMVLISTVVMAVVAAELATWALYRFALELDWSPHLLFWLLTPVVAALLIGCAGVWGTRAVVRQSPMRLISRGA